jgi:hypothetical protein
LLNPSKVAGLRAFVFVETTAATRRRFLGVATPTDVRRSLGLRYPWFEETFVKALRDYYPNEVMTAGTTHPDATLLSDWISPLLTADPTSISNLAQHYVERLQCLSPPPLLAASFLELKEPSPIWERAAWIDGELLERDLQGVLEYAWVPDSPDSPKWVLAERIARRRGSFVAIVERDQRFVSLVDRWALVEEPRASGSNARHAHRAA